MVQRIVLAGNAVTAHILHDYLQADSRFELVGVTVDDEFVANGSVGGLPILPFSKLESAFPPGGCRIVMAVGYNDLNRVRESLFLRLREKGYVIECYVHPGAQIHTRVPLGEGCVILPGAIIEPGVTVGENTMVWSNVTLAHHCRVAEHCWIAAGAVVSGQAKVHRNSFVGVNATIVNEITVGEYNVVGAAALISKDTKPNTVHLARSAEPLRYSAEDYFKHFGV